MGTVYKAIDTRLGRTVAIKTLAAGHGQRSLQGARAIAALSHPHICVLHDVGPDYLVIEYLEGAPLHGPLPLDQALRMVVIRPFEPLFRQSAAWPSVLNAMNLA